MTESSPAELRKVLRKFQQTVCADAKAPVRVKAVNTLLNSGYNLSILNDQDVESLWESLFFALWYAEMGRGCEEIIAAIERACLRSYKLTRVGFITISKKWYGLDQHRVDKISHLARHLLSVLIEQQIKLWIENKKKRKLGAQNVCCKQLIRKVLLDIIDSYGLCYFILEALADEVSKSLTRSYDRLHIIVGKFEIKANLVVFIYRQVIDFATNIKLDARLLRTFDQYVIRKFVIEILPNESQLTQILITLRLYQSLDKCLERKKSPITGRCKALFERWSDIIREIHDKCINGEFFPTSSKPVQSTITTWKPHLNQTG